MTADNCALHSHAASPEDGKAILRILESSAAKGSIELLYTRRPDAYASYMKEVGEARVFASKDSDRLIGTCAELVREVYIGGERAKAAYLCGLKKDADYAGGVCFDARFMRALQRDDIDFYYCSVIADNDNALAMFGKSRRILSMKPIGAYTTYILSPKVKLKAPKHSMHFRQANDADLPKLLSFLNSEGRKKDLFPVIDALEDLHDLSVSDFYLLTEGERIVAAAALWNQVGYKQYVVKKYRGLMRFARLANPLLSLLGYIRLPKENEPLDFPMLSFFVSLDDNEDYYRVFFGEIKRVIAQKYGMFVIGLPKDHFAAKIFDRLPSIHFDTKLYAITFPWSKQAYKEVSTGKLCPECGLL